MEDLKRGSAFFGVMELFSVLLPGALLAAALLVILSRMALPLQFDQFGTGAQWVVFAAISYVLGHFVFVVASELDRFYDRYRKWRWPSYQRDAYTCATAMRHGFFGTKPLAPGAPELDAPMNTLSWAKSMLMQKAPAAFTDVERYEADSKFFRSLAVVLPFAGLVPYLTSVSPFATDPSFWWTAVGGLLLSAASLYRYAERRHKSTEWAYRHVLVLCGLPATPEQGAAQRA